MNFNVNDSKNGTIKDFMKSINETVSVGLIKIEDHLKAINEMAASCLTAVSVGFAALVFLQIVKMIFWRREKKKERNLSPSPTVGNSNSADNNRVVIMPSLTSAGSSTLGNNPAPSTEKEEENLSPYPTVRYSNSADKNNVVIEMSRRTPGAAGSSTPGNNPGQCEGLNPAPSTEQNDGEATF